MYTTSYTVFLALYTGVYTQTYERYAQERDREKDILYLSINHLSKGESGTLETYYPGPFSTVTQTGLTLV